MDALFTNTLQSPWKAYCISLPRCEQRRETFRSWAAENGLTFTFWDGCDKQTLPQDYYEQKKVLVGNNFSKGATACRISHESLWNHILLNDTQYKTILIFEDDAGFQSKSLSDLQTFLKGVSKLSKPWSALQLGFGTMTGSDLHLLSARNPEHIFKVDFCDQTHAVIYTREAIQGMVILSGMKKYKTCPSDGLLLAYIQRKMGIVYAPRTSIVEQVDTVSYISDIIPTS
jgi:GR25 family glycosyltransferase involved in LPS biosynthesis